MEITHIAVFFTRTFGSPGGSIGTAHGVDSEELTCPLCAQGKWVGRHPPHTKGPEETKIACAQRGELMFRTKSSWSRLVSKKIKRHHLCLTTLTDVVSFNMAVNLIYHTDQMLKS